MDRSVKYLLLGGGLTSANAAGAIRENDAEGSVLLVGAEPYLPYDRPPYSKNFLTDDEMKPEDTHSKPEDFYQENNLEVLTGTEARKIDPGRRSVTLSNGDTVTYQKLLIATGARPNPLGVAGEDLEGVHLLREAEDGIRIREGLKNCQKIALVGAGFIGMEVAADSLVRGRDTTVITHGGRIWSQLKPSDALQNFLRTTYEGKGAKFLFNEEIAALEGEGGKLRAVRTKSGTTVEADTAIVAVGVTLNAELAKEAGLEVTDRNEIKVNEYLQTSDPHIYAAGDVARFPDIALGKEWHVEHYMNAMWQGEAVGAIMAGEQKPYDQVAYFFSDEFDLSMIMRGDPDAGQGAKVVGDMASGNFVELYADDSGRVRMGVAFNHDYDKLEPIADTLEQLIRERKSVSEVDDSQFQL
jgi:3-phenylpropionate/trans-cinnamate dioxygenase ferredoxin reductase subunit